MTEDSMHRTLDAALARSEAGLAGRVAALADEWASYEWQEPCKTNGRKMFARGYEQAMGQVAHDLRALLDTTPAADCQSCHDGRDLARGWECSGCGRSGDVERAVPPAPSVAGPSAEDAEALADAAFDAIHKALCDERLIHPDADSDALVDWIAAHAAAALLPVVTQAQAEAWDEGYELRAATLGMTPDPNPYRARADESGAR